MREERKKRGEGGRDLSYFFLREKRRTRQVPPPLCAAAAATQLFLSFPPTAETRGEIVFLEKTLERSPPSSPQTDLGQKSRREGEVIASYGKRPLGYKPLGILSSPNNDSGFGSLVFRRTFSGRQRLPRTATAKSLISVKFLTCLEDRNEVNSLSTG